MSKESATNLRDEFFARMGTGQQLRILFEHLAGVYFFIKDDQSRLIAANRGILDRLGAKDETDIVGTTDHDYFPPEIADSFVRDDEQVLKTGQPITGKVEIWFNEQRVLDWFVTSKFPIRDAAGRVIGVMGITQSYEGKRRDLLPLSSISKAVELIRHNCHRNLSSQELAKSAGVSVRHLNRKFQEAFKLSPHEFALRTRLQGACETLIRTDKPIIQIALDYGFCDQSAFTKQFRHHMGVTPAAYRKRYQVV